MEKVNESDDSGLSGVKEIDAGLSDRNQEMEHECLWERERLCGRVRERERDRAEKKYETEQFIFGIIFAKEKLKKKTKKSVRNFNRLFVFAVSL